MDDGGFSCWVFLDLLSLCTILFNMSQTYDLVTVTLRSHFPVTAARVVVLNEEGVEEGLLASDAPYAICDEDDQNVKWFMSFIVSALVCLLVLTMCLIRVSFILYMISKNMESQQLVLMHVIENM
jgi:hypothetical protein